MKTMCARSWLPSRSLTAAVLLLVLAGAGARTLGATLTLAAGRVTTTTAATVVVPVLATNFNGVSLFQFSLHWDPAAASFLGVEQFGLAGMGAANFGTVQTAAGTLTVSWDDPNGASTTVANGTMLFGVRLQVLGASGTTSPITLDGNPTPVEAADENFVTRPVVLLNGLLSILAQELPPQITAQPQSMAVTAGSTATFSVTASGPGSLGHQWRFNGVSMPGQTESSLVLTGVQAAQAGGYTVVVTNHVGSSTSEVATLTVTAPNAAPILGALPTRTVAEGTLLSFTLPATDADQPAQSLAYSLVGDVPPGLVLNATNGLLTWSPTELQGPSTNVVTVRVTDNGVPALSDTRSFTIVVQEVNSPPKLTPVANRVINEGSLLSFTVMASDSDQPTNRLTFSLDPGAPATATIHPQTGEFLWTALEDRGPSVITVTIRVTDNGSPALSDTTTFSITVNEVNAPPVLTAPGNRVVPEGSVLAFDVVAADSDLPAQTLFYTLDPGAPAGATINALTGAFSWTPSEADGPGTNLITIRVTDNGSPMLSDAKSFQVIVTEVNAAPSLAAPAEQVVLEGQTLLLTNRVTDLDLPAQTITYTLAGGVPSGLTLNPVSGVLAWPTGEAHGPSTNRVTLIASDNGIPVLSSTQSLLIVVLESNRAPVLEPIPDQLAQVMTALILTNVVTDADVPTNRFSFQFIDAPKGARMNRLTGVIYWSPSRDQARSTNVFQVIVMDDGSPSLMATNSFQVVVEDFVEVMLGEAVLRAGDSGSVPLYLSSSVGVTNLVSSLLLPEGRLSGLSLKGSVPEVGATDLEMLAAGRGRLSVATRPGLVLAAEQRVGDLNFTAVSTQSAFVDLSLEGIQARQTNGVLVSRTIAGSGRVVVVAEEPLLEALVETNRQRRLVLYGPPGHDYQIQKSLRLTAGAWEEAWQGPLTNLYQVIPVTETNGMFYRARRVP